MQNIIIYGNGSAYMIMCDGLIVGCENSADNARKHIQWMYEVASQKFTVGKVKIPVRDWIKSMMEQGYLEKKYAYFA